MADSDAVRQRRRRQHKQGDHSLCRNCEPGRASLQIAGVPPDAGENLDPAAALRDLAVQLCAAYRADPANAALAREARTTLLALVPQRGDGVDIEWAALMREMSTPVPAEEANGYDIGGSAS